MDQSRYEGPATLDDVIARSKRSSKIQEHALDLPDISPVTEKRPLHIRHEDLERHLGPLLSCHWHVDRLVAKTTYDFDVLTLNKLFGFKDFRSAVAFFNSLAVIQEEEDHHALVTVNYATVYVSVHTHVASQRTPGSEAGESKPIKAPGLTARDVRFAVRVETLHQKFLDEQLALTKVPVDSERRREWSMDQLRRRYPPLNGQSTEHS